MLERVGYVDGFPNLLGTVHTFTGSAQRWHELQLARHEQGAAWHSDQRITDVAVLPATCYHLYPLFEGQDLTEPVVLTAEAYCYRNEETHERGRLRSFRMREFVRVGCAAEVAAWRDSDGAVQAVASSNCHKDHFGAPFAIRIGGETAHTACAAFGLERITLALLAAHGTDPVDWPAHVRAALPSE